MLIHAVESRVKQHPAYLAAKSGDAAAALQLVEDVFDIQQVAALRRLVGDCHPILVSAHAYEREGVNAIPEVLADVMGQHLGWAVDGGVVQTNVVAHTGADGFSRLARQPAFDGAIDRCRLCHGGRLRRHGRHSGEPSRTYRVPWGRVLAAVVLTGKPQSAKLQLSPERLKELGNTHGTELEHWWQERFGHAFDALTESEARYLVRTPDIATVRNRIAAAEQAGGRPQGGAG